MASDQLTVPEIVVDPTGRAYAGMSASHLSTAESANQIVAIDPDGSVAWQLPFATPVSSLTLASDGMLWVVGSPANVATPSCGSCAGYLSTVTRDGAVKTTIAVGGPPPSSTPPVLYQGLALGTDGAVFLQGFAGAPDFGSPGALALLDDAGTVVWDRLLPLPSPPQGPTLPVVVSSTNGTISSDGAVLRAIDSTGLLQWQGAAPTQALALASNGRVLMVTTDPSQANAWNLEGLDESGALQLRVPLAPGGPAKHFVKLAVAADGTSVVLIATEANDGSTVRSRLWLWAFDPSGARRWFVSRDESVPEDATYDPDHYGLLIDGAGTLVVTAGEISAFDLETGGSLWSLAPANAASCVRPVVLGTEGSLLTSQCDGTIFRIGESAGGRHP